MEYNFKQAVRLSVGDKSLTFKLGLNEVPKEFESHWYFLKLVQSGYVLDVDEKVIEKPSDRERSKMLYEKLTAAAPVVNHEAKSYKEKKSRG